MSVLPLPSGPTTRRGGILQPAGSRAQHPTPAACNHIISMDGDGQAATRMSPHGHVCQGKGAAFGRAWPMGTSTSPSAPPTGQQHTRGAPRGSLAAWWPGDTGAGPARCLVEPCLRARLGTAPTSCRALGFRHASEPNFRLPHPAGSACPTPAAPSKPPNSRRPLAAELARRRPRSQRLPGSRRAGFESAAPDASAESGRAHCARGQR